MTRHVTFMTIDDAEHYTPEQRQTIINAYPEHEREARTKGIPSMGSGRVFPISEEVLTRVWTFASLITVVFSSLTRRRRSNRHSSPWF